MGQLNYSTAEINDLLASAANLENVSYTAAQINSILAGADKVNTAFDEMLNVKFANNGGDYCIFARVHHSTWGSANHFSALLSGGGSYSSNLYGLYWVDGQCRSNNKNMSAKQIIAPGSGTPVFGHYDGGDGYEYFGVKRGSAQIVVWPLNITHNDGNAEFKNWAMTSTQPTGWTTISIT